MGDHQVTIYAHTELTPAPAYINLSERVSNPGDTILTVRSSGENGASSIVLERRHLHALVTEVQAYLDKTK